MPPMKYWEVVAKKLNAAGWTWGYWSVVTRNGWRWIVDAEIYKKPAIRNLVV